jgi:hypothetical protein
VVGYVRQPSFELAGFSVHDSRNHGLNVELALFLGDRVSAGTLGTGHVLGPQPFKCALHSENAIDPFNNRRARGGGKVVLCKLIGFIQWKASERVSLGGFFRIGRTGIQVWHKI